MHLGDVDICITCLSAKPPVLPLREEVLSEGFETVLLSTLGKTQTPFKKAIDKGIQKSIQESQKHWSRAVSYTRYCSSGEYILKDQDSKCEEDREIRCIDEDSESSLSCSSSSSLSLSSELEDESKHQHHQRSRYKARDGSASTRRNNNADTNSSSRQVVERVEDNDENEKEQQQQQEQEQLQKNNSDRNISPQNVSNSYNPKKTQQYLEEDNATPNNGYDDRKYDHHKNKSKETDNDNNNSKKNNNIEWYHNCNQQGMELYTTATDPNTYQVPDTEECTDVCLQIFDCFFVLLETAQPVDFTSSFSEQNPDPNQKQHKEDRITTPESIAVVDEVTQSSLLFGMTSKNATPLVSVCGKGFTSPTDLKIFLEAHPEHCQVFSEREGNLPLHVLCTRGLSITKKKQLSYHEYLEERVESRSSSFPLVVADEKWDERSIHDEIQEGRQEAMDVVQDLYDLLKILLDCYPYAATILNLEEDLPCHLLSRQFIHQQHQHPPEETEKEVRTNEFITKRKRQCMELLLYPLITSYNDIVQEENENDTAKPSSKSREFFYDNYSYRGSVGIMLPLHLGIYYNIDYDLMYQLTMAFPVSVSTRCRLEHEGDGNNKELLPIELLDRLHYKNWEEEEKYGRHDGDSSCFTSNASFTSTLSSFEEEDDNAAHNEKKQASSSSSQHSKKQQQLIVVEEYNRKSDLLFSLHPNITPYRTQKSRLKRFEILIRNYALDDTTTTEQSSSTTIVTCRLIWIFLCTFSNPWDDADHYAAQCKQIIKGLNEIQFHKLMFLRYETSKNSSYIEEGSGIVNTSGCDSGLYYNCVTSPTSIHDYSTASIHKNEEEDVATTTIIESAVLPVKRVFQMYYEKLRKKNRKTYKISTTTSPLPIQASASSPNLAQLKHRISSALLSSFQNKKKSLIKCNTSYQYDSTGRCSVSSDDNNKSSISLGLLDYTKRDHVFMICLAKFLFHIPTTTTKLPTSFTILPYEVSWSAEENQLQLVNPAEDGTIALQFAEQVLKVNDCDIILHLLKKRMEQEEENCMLLEERCGKEMNSDDEDQNEILKDDSSSLSSSSSSFYSTTSSLQPSSSSTSYDAEVDDYADDEGHNNHHKNSKHHHHKHKHNENKRSAEEISKTIESFINTCYSSQAYFYFLDELNGGIPITSTCLTIENPKEFMNKVFPLLQLSILLMRGCQKGLFLLAQFIVRSYVNTIDASGRLRKQRDGRGNNNKAETPSFWWINEDIIPLELIQKIKYHEIAQDYICLYHALMDFWDLVLKATKHKHTKTSSKHTISWEEELILLEDVCTSISDNNKGKGVDGLMKRVGKDGCNKTGHILWTQPQSSQTSKIVDDNLEERDVERQDDIMDDGSISSHNNTSIHSEEEVDKEDNDMSIISLSSDNSLVSTSHILCPLSSIATRKSYASKNRSSNQEKDTTTYTKNEEKITVIPTTLSSPDNNNTSLKFSPLSSIATKKSYASSNRSSNQERDTNTYTKNEEKITVVPTTLSSPDNNNTSLKFSPLSSIATRKSYASSTRSSNQEKDTITYTKNEEKITIIPTTLSSPDNNNTSLKFSPLSSIATRKSYASKNRSSNQEKDTTTYTKNEEKITIIPTTLSSPDNNNTSLKFSPLSSIATRKSYASSNRSSNQEKDTNTYTKNEEKITVIPTTLSSPDNNNTLLKFSPLSRTATRKSYASSNMSSSHGRSGFMSLADDITVGTDANTTDVTSTNTDPEVSSVLKSIEYSNHSGSNNNDDDNNLPPPPPKDDDFQVILETIITTDALQSNAYTEENIVSDENQSDLSILTISTHALNYHNEVDDALLLDSSDTNDKYHDIKRPDSYISATDDSIASSFQEGLLFDGDEEMVGTSNNSSNIIIQERKQEAEIAINTNDQCNTTNTRKRELLTPSNTYTTESSSTSNTNSKASKTHTTNRSDPKNSNIINQWRIAIQKLSSPTTNSNSNEDDENFVNTMKDLMAEDIVSDYEYRSSLYLSNQSYSHASNICHEEDEDEDVNDETPTTKNDNLDSFLHDKKKGLNQGTQVLEILSDITLTPPRPETKKTLAKSTKQKEQAGSNNSLYSELKQFEEEEAELSLEKEKLISFLEEEFDNYRELVNNTQSPESSAISSSSTSSYRRITQLANDTQSPDFATKSHHIESSAISSSSTSSYRRITQWHTNDTTRTIKEQEEETNTTKQLLLPSDLTNNRNDNRTITKSKETNNSIENALAALSERKKDIQEFERLMMEH